MQHRNVSAWYNIDTEYLGIFYEETKQWKFQNGCSLHFNRKTDSFAVLNIPLQSLVNPPSCFAATYAKNKAGIEKRCSLQIRNTNSATIPAMIAPNIWILTLASTAVSTETMIICPDKAPMCIKTQMSIHILHLPLACSITSQHFHLPSHYETHQLTINISFNTVNLNVMNTSSPEFRIWQHLEYHWNGTQLHHLANIPSVPVDQLNKHMVSSNGPITPFISTDEPIDDTTSLWTLFSHTRNLCNGYSITDTCQIRDIMLLLFLVLTCQISALTLRSGST